MAQIVGYNGHYYAEYAIVNVHEISWQVYTIKL
jgi:hypothetical protein